MFGLMFRWLSFHSGHQQVLALGECRQDPSRSHACGPSQSSQREGQLGSEHLSRAQQPGTQGQCRGLSGCHG